MKLNKNIFIIFMLMVGICAPAANAAYGKVTVAQAFYEVAHQQNSAKIKQLQQRGYSIESVDEQGYNPLCLAVAKKDRSAYQLLIEHGAQRKPRCLQKIPESSYRQFFGNSKNASSYTSDTPYLIGAAALGAGVATAAYLLRGNTSKKSHSSHDDSTCVNGIYNQETKRCDCSTGYGNYGNEQTCYSTIAHCRTQNKNTCTTCDSGYNLKNNVCYLSTEPTCANGSYNTKTNSCECNSGYGNYGDKTQCYRTIAHCQQQNKATCMACTENYLLENNACYSMIPQCQTQKTDTCEKCQNGYGTYGDKHACYATIKHCMNQKQNVCAKCDTGYDTYGDSYHCYAQNPCASYEHAAPYQENGETKCRCDEKSGFFGELGNCIQAETEEYQEGEGNKEEWNNLNEKYCHAHGKYDPISGLCTCYRGYADAANGCAECATGYLDFNGLCYADLQCAQQGAGYIQQNGMCVCDSGYFEHDGRCVPAVQCPQHYEQTNDSQIVEEACTCKPNFDENCEKCKDGFEYNSGNDECIRTHYQCDEKWTGADCTICPLQYAVVFDQGGTAHCGTECAENRAPYDEVSNAECQVCAAGYEYSALDNNCITTECSTGVDGYIRDEKGHCTCNAEQGYAMSLLGKCVKKGPDLVEITDRNINNSKIEVINNGEINEFRDVYGMKPVASTSATEVEYYENVYNALASTGTKEATINISNLNTGANSVYGIYSPSALHNAAAINASISDVTAKANINISDSNTLSQIYGMKSDSGDSIYNALAIGSGKSNTDFAANSISEADINITKAENSSGKIVAISGKGNILNAYANTTDGIAANVSTTGNINVEHLGKGTVIGIEGNSATHKINNALAFLDSPVSNSLADGTIQVSGNENVYGIYSNGSVINSETQFSKSFAKVNDFAAQGKIIATANTNNGTAYGIYVANNGNTEASIYNAMGYQSSGNIEVNHKSGGSAYGLWNGAKIYEQEENGAIKSFYNNTYNAFRSSAKYGTENTPATGNIIVNLEGNSNSLEKAVGIYAAGNVFNAYANSGSDVMLKTVGEISINDNSRSSNMLIRGIESGGATIANAYATGTNKNNKTAVAGNINLHVSSNKQGAIGEIAGIYSDEPSAMVSKIYNAALINDQSNVEGNITITADSATTFNHMYGIYASKYQLNGQSPEEGQEKVVYNAYYDNESSTQGVVKGNITITAPNRSPMSTAEYYGIYVNEGTAHNVYATNNKTDDIFGTISLNVGGGENSGIAAGMAGYKASLYNNGANAKIEVTTTRNNSQAYGMKGNESYLENNGTINVNSEKDIGYGLYVNKGQAVNGKEGVLNVSGKMGAYGIYVVADGTSAGAAQAINEGKINLSGEGKNIGIYASGSNATVQNNGNITINGEENKTVCEGENCDSSAIQLTNGAKLINNGNISGSSIRLASIGGEVILDKNGSFTASQELSGELKVSTDTVINSFSNEEVIADAVAAADVSQLQLTSKSYLYDATIKENDSGKYDVTMQKKDFSEITSNSSETAYLNQNYAQQKNSQLFNSLKNPATAAEARKLTANVMGTAMLPNIAEEELKVQRSLDRNIINELFKPAEEERRIVGADAMHVGRGNSGTLTGYDIDSQSMYAVYDKKLDNHHRWGLGMSMTHTNTDYNDDSSRKNMTFQGYMPFTYSNGNGLTAVTMARIGYADGDYTRKSQNKSYKADTSAWNYGLINEARYTVSTKYANLTPFIGLNAIGWYQKAINEGKNALALHLDAENIFSLESALGVYLDKEVEFNENNRLNVALGIGYYHEFADPYRGFEAHHGDGVLGNYKLRNKIHSRDRGILSAKVNYDYKNFSIYGELMQYLEEEHPLEVEGGIRYRF